MDGQTGRRTICEPFKILVVEPLPLPSRAERERMALARRNGSGQLSFRLPEGQKGFASDRRCIYLHGACEGEV